MGDVQGASQPHSIYNFFPILSHVTLAARHQFDLQVPKEGCSSTAFLAPKH
jgi:hypothetical protein